MRVKVSDIAAAAEGKLLCGDENTVITSFITDSQEAKDFVKLSFEISEKFDVPVLFRSVMRISHCKTVCELGERVENPKHERFEVTRLVLKHDGLLTLERVLAGEKG